MKRGKFVHGLVLLMKVLMFTGVLEHFYCVYKNTAEISMIQQWLLKLLRRGARQWRELAPRVAVGVLCDGSLRRVVKDLFIVTRILYKYGI